MAPEVPSIGSARTVIANLSTEARFSSTLQAYFSSTPALLFICTGLPATARCAWITLLPEQVRRCWRWTTEVNEWVSPQMLDSDN